MHASYVLGYDSDDEEDNDTKSTRRIRGKKYVSIPKDDSFDQPVHRVNGANGHHENNQQKTESIDYYLKKTRRGSSCVDSDSEYGSDKESPSKTSYVKEKNPGGISYILRSMNGYLYILMFNWLNFHTVHLQILFLLLKLIVKNIDIRAKCHLVTFCILKFQTQ